MRYTVHEHVNGQDRVLGHFIVTNGAIHFDSMADEYNCGMFPPGPMSPMTQARLQSRLNNHDKTIYLTRG